MATGKADAIEIRQSCDTPDMQSLGAATRMPAGVRGRRRSVPARLQALNLALRGDRELSH
jgi:hypothetical protein